MTRARKSLTLCEAVGGQQPFVRDLDRLVLRSRPTALPPEPGVAHRTWCADPEKTVLSWPGYYGPAAPIHRALAALDVGSPLELRPRSDGKDGWEISDAAGVAVGQMSSKFRPPKGEVVAVRVAAMLVRHAREDERERVRCSSWELVLPEIEYVPQ
jgi:ATP-dependent DNA helicase RecQ